jgi:hypothetical protein
VKGRGKNTRLIAAECQRFGLPFFLTYDRDSIQLLLFPLNQTTCRRSVFLLSAFSECTPIFLGDNKWISLYSGSG